MIFQCLCFEQKGVFVAKLQLKDRSVYPFFGFIDDKLTMKQVENLKIRHSCHLGGSTMSYPQSYPQA